MRITLLLLLTLSTNLFAQSNEACLEILRGGLIALQNHDDSNVSYHDQRFESQCEATAELDKLAENDPHFIALMQAIDNNDEGLFAPKVCLEIIRGYWVSYEKNSTSDETLHKRYTDNCVLEKNEYSKNDAETNSYGDLNYRKDLITSDAHIQDIIQRLRESGLYTENHL